MGGFTFAPIKDNIRELYLWYQTHVQKIDVEALRFDG